MGLSDDTPIAEVVGLKEAMMTNDAALVVIVVSVVIATFVSGTIGMIVAAVGVIGLILAVLSGSRDGQPPSEAGGISVGCHEQLPGRLAGWPTPRPVADTFLRPARGIAPRPSEDEAESTRGEAADSAETGEAQAMVSP